MEEDIQIDSNNKLNKKLVKRVKSAIEIAEERLNYEFAHNEKILKALNIVRDFIKERKRVCYGGTAMNMILPESARFYNMELETPDYDFFTPVIEDDIKCIIDKLNKEGFKDVFHKIGIHEGTSKILVDFVAVADITQISPPLFKIIKSRSIVVDNIHYTDPDVLRMMMYLELSRPRGMVSRWEKVYQRLQLINKFFPPKQNKRSTRKVEEKGANKKVPSSLETALVNYCIDNESHVFIGPFEQFYSGVISGKNDIFNLKKFTGIIGILSSDIEKESENIKKYLGEIKTTAYFQKAKGEFVPEYCEIRYNSIPVFIILKEVACNSYLTFNTDDGRKINISSPDTLITLWYGISIFTENLKKRIKGIDKIIPKLINLVESNRNSKRPKIPAFYLNCIGYQKGYPTLLKEKMIRKKKLES